MVEHFMAWVYILKSTSFPKTYIGSTTDLNRRLAEHDRGHTYFTKNFGPWRLVYQEEYASLEQARQQEKYFKSAAGRRFIRANNIIPR